MRTIAPGVVEYGPPGMEDAVPAVTMYQLRSALLAASKLDAAVTFMTNLSEPQKSRAKVFWEARSTVRRDDTALAALAAGLGLNSAALDTLFASAAAIS